MSQHLLYFHLKSLLFENIFCIDDEFCVDVLVEQFAMHYFLFNSSNCSFLFFPYKNNAVFKNIIVDRKKFDQSVSMFQCILMLFLN